MKARHFVRALDDRGAKALGYSPLRNRPLLLMRLARRLQSEYAHELQFSVILEPQPDGGFTVLVPALPEVVTEGETDREALLNAEEAIRAVLEYRRAHGLNIPPMRLPKSAV